MIPLTKAKLDTLFTAVNTTFNKALGAPPPFDYKRIATVAPSRAAIESYPIALYSGGMREWIGERVFNDLEVGSLEIKNKMYEDSVSMDRLAILRDTAGVYLPQIEQMAQNANMLWPGLIAALMIANPKWADGAAFFLASRKFGKATINNVSEAYLSVAAYNIAYAAMMSYKAADGKTRLNIVPDTLIVGPDDRSMGAEIVNAPIVANGNAGVTNTNAGTTELAIWPELAGTRFWFLAKLKGAVKPAVVQQEILPVLTRIDQETSELVFMNNKNYYGTSASGNAGLVVPQLLYRGGKAS
jgi:phage major head subunit gpT-like protein